MSRLLLAIFAAVFSVTANAVVVRNLNGIDYEWLELSHTLSMSRNSVQLELDDPTSDLYGWEYASRQLVEDLFRSYAPFPGTVSVQSNPAVVSGIDALINDFGVTSGWTGDGINEPLETVDGDVLIDGEREFIALYGLADECGGVPGYNFSQTCRANASVFVDADGNAVATRQSYRSGWDASNLDPLQYRKQYPNPEYGSFLVRTSVVPIPAAAWLFGSALAGLGWLRRRQTV
ncbi:MAG: VPLPA-CTERM sorting domain-containing protein [Gammaproteobacteria bacterium]